MSLSIICTTKGITLKIANASNVLSTAVASRPNPAETPMAAVIHNPAAVVRPLTWPSSPSLFFRMVPAPEKADPGDHTLHHPAHGVGLGAGHLRHQHKQRRPQRHQHVGAHPGGLALVLAFEAENPAQHRGHQQAHGNARQL